jgi:hypothetical protein
MNSEFCSSIFIFILFYFLAVENLTLTRLSKKNAQFINGLSLNLHAEPPPQNLESSNRRNTGHDCWIQNT